MKMDMELIKKILLYVEKYGEPGKLMRQVEIEGYSVQNISYHIKLLTENGLLEGRSAGIDGHMLWYAGDITWEGHEFIAASKNENVWSTFKEKLGDQIQTIPLSVMSGLLMELSKEYFREKLGLK